MTVRDLLLRAYPRSWQSEFGPELDDILANRKLTATLIADVLVSAALAHLRQDDPWKICSVGLSLWTAVLMIFVLKGFGNHPAFVWCYFIGQLFLFAAGAWTGLRENSGIWSATTASLRAAVVPVAAWICLSSLSVLHYWHYWGSLREAYRHTVYWILGQLAVTILVSLLFGLGGASLPRVVRLFRGTTKARL